MLVMFPMTAQLYPLVYQLGCGISAGAGGVMVWASALRAESRAFDFRAGAAHFPILFCFVFFLSGCLLCGSRFMMSKFGCNTLGWRAVSFIFINIFS